MDNFWKRCLARLMDWGLFYILGVFCSLILPIEFDEKLYFAFALAVPFLWAPLEAILLSTWETTPGKLLFGIHIRGLDFVQSLKRSFFIGKRSGEMTVRPTGRWRMLLSVVLTLMCGSSLFLGNDISDAAVEFERKATGDNWIQYASDDGKFKVQFPKKPKILEPQQYEVPNGKPLDLTEVKAVSDVAFSVTYLELPKKWRIFSTATLLKGAIKVVVEHMPEAELIEKKIVKHKNYPAMDFKLKQGDEEIEGRLILVGGTLYKLTVSYPPQTDREGQHETFLNSFEMNLDS